MEKDGVKKLLILIIAVALIGSAVAFQFKEPTQSEANNLDSNQFELREIFFKSPLELSKSVQHPEVDKDCSVVFVGCTEVNG